MDLQFNDFINIVLQDFPIIWKNSPEHLKLQYEASKCDVKLLNVKYTYVQNGYASVESTIIQVSNPRLDKRRIDGYIDYFNEKY